MRFLKHSAILAASILPAAFLFSADPPPPSPVAGPEYTTDGQLKFPEHYREWVYLSSGVGMTYGPIAEAGAWGPPMFDNIFVNPEAYRGFLETGRWPEKTILVMEARFSESHASINNGGHFQTDLVGVEAHVKDSSSPAGVWNFYGFSIDGGKRQAAAKPVPHTASCFTCHGVKTAVENTFVQFYPPLYDVAERKGTLNPGFEKLPITPGKLYQALLEGGWKEAGPRLLDAAVHAPDANVLNGSTLGIVASRLIQGNRAKDAVGVLEFASARNPKSANLQDLLGDAYEKLGDKAAARTATERSLALLKDDPTLPDGMRKRIPTRAAERMKRLQAPSPKVEFHGGLPSVSPDGSRIAFVGDRGGVQDVFAIAPAGTGEVQLTHTPDRESAPSWAGREIVFSVFANDQSAVYAIDPDGRNERRIGTVPGRSPAPSPDGKLLAYSVGPFTDSRLVVSAPDGAAARDLTDGSEPAFNAAWSADGKWIAFARMSKDRSLHLWLANADGTGQRELTQIPAEEGSAQWPAWSPDGRTLAVQVGKYSPQESIAHIWTVDVATGAAHKLAAHSEPYLDETPSWFPDGKRIAFQSSRTGRMEIWIMNADGSDARQVTK